MTTAPGPSVERKRPPPAGPLRPFSFPEVHRRSLSNGIPVWIAPRHDLPVVSVRLLTRAGATRDPDSRGGLAALTSELLESGAGDRDAARIAEDLETLGVQFDTAASWDVGAVSLTSLRSRLAEALPILSDVVRRPTFPADEVERLRAEQLANILQRRADPGGLATEAILRFTYADEAPFSRPLSGTRQTVEAITRSDVAEFHGVHYGAVGAAIVVVGDIPTDDATELAERFFGGWGGGSAEPARVATEPAEREADVIVVDRPSAVQSEIRLGQVGVPRSTPDYFPLIVLNTLFGGAFSSRLNLNLRETQGFTYGVHSSFTMRRQAGPFVVSTAVATDVTAAAMREIFRELDRIRAEEVTAAELSDARNYLAGVLPLRLETTGGVAARVAEQIVHDLPPDFWEQYPQRVLAVSAEEVLRVAQEYLRPDAMARVIVGDAEKLIGPLEDAGWEKIRTVAADELAT